MNCLKSFFFVAIFFFSICIKSSAFENDSLSTKNQIKNYFPLLGNNLAKQYSAPFKWNSKEWIIASGIGCSIIGVGLVDSYIDRKISPFTTNYKNLKPISKNITEFGRYYGLGGLALFFATNCIIKNQKGVETSLLASQAIFTSAVLITVLKITTGRERPYLAHAENRNYSKWYGPQNLKKVINGTSFSSFPSGHTAIAFSIATIFAKQYPSITWVAPVGYSLATLVGFSRITENKHWASDVLMGAVLGYFCAKQIHKNKGHLSSISLGRKKTAKANSIQFVFSPFIG